MREEFALFNLVRYTTFRAGAACLTALIFSLVLGPAMIRWLRASSAAASRSARTGRRATW